jgi:hypothetical protein
VAPECSQIFIPDHEHHVRLTLIHSELNATYGLRDSVAVSFRLPYDVKQQRVRYTTLTGEPYVPPYGDIHHRSETLQGLSDADLLLVWAPAASGRSHWRIAVGSTLPIGHTVPDPIELGREGKTHEHLQFGSGVFAPEAELGWSGPVGRIDASALIQATIPVSTNSHGFRAPNNFRWSFGPAFTMGRWQTAIAAAGQYQTVGRWNGEADEGTGFSNGGLRLLVVFPQWRGVTVQPSVYRELYSHGLNDETFAQGTTLGLTLTRTF